MKKIVLAGLTVLSLTAPAAFAQKGYYPCQGYGCGMMMGPGMMGPGMMGGYGMGPGMMGGYGMGPGMMGGYGMGPGMMGGYGYGGPYSGGPDLTKEQAEKIDRIRDDLAKKEAPLMRQLFEEKRKLQDMYSSGADPTALDQAYRKTTDIERQVFDARADAQKRMNAVLTKEQRERMQRMQRGYNRGYAPGMWRDYDPDMMMSPGMMMGPGMWDWD
jgi:Spy/CpxP family protein refolding chaperone